MFLSFLQKYKPRSYGIIFLIILSISIFMPVYQAHAQLISYFTSNAVSSLIGGTLNFVRAAMGGLIALMGSWVDSVLNEPITDVGVVQSSWELTRNFANMFFIIALIIMAFATIFSVGSFQQYSFSSLIVRFLIAALLINFSLVIGEIIINWSASLSNVFLQAMGDVGARIGQAAKLGDRFAGDVGITANLNSVDLSAWQLTIGVFANIILLSIILFSMAVLLFFSVVRIPVLWALLILSPMAWILYILPSTRKYNQMWWDYFISWNLFMPIYLFFIYFGILFLNKQGEILSKSTTNISLPGLDAGVGVQTIFFYILIGLFLIYGAKAAMGFSRAGGAGALAGWAYGKNAALRRLPGRAVGLGWRATGAEDVYKDARKTFKEQGFAGFEATEKNLGKYYQGQQGRDKAAAWLGAKTGLAPGLAGKQFDKNISNYQEKYRTITDESKLRGLATTGPLEQQVAASNRLRELGQLSTSEELGLYSQLSSAGEPLAARKQAEKMDYGSMSKTERETAYNTITDLDIKRKIQNIRQKKGDFVDATSMQHEATLFTAGSEDELEFYKNGKSVITDSFTTAERSAFYNNTALNPEVRRMVSEIMIDKGELRGTELQNALSIIPGSTATAGTPEHRAYLNEANRLLEKARKHDLVNAVQIQTQLGLVANKSGPPGAMFTPTQQGAALQQELGNLSVSKILELPDPVLASPEFVTTIVPTLNIVKIEKLLTDASPNQRAIIEPAIVARRTILSNDTLSTKTQSLGNALKRLQNLTRQIRSAPTPNDKKAFAAQAQESLDRSQKLIGEIEDIKYADQALKDSARSIFDHYTGSYYKTIQ